MVRKHASCALFDSTATQQVMTQPRLDGNATIKSLAHSSSRKLPRPRRQPGSAAAAAWRKTLACVIRHICRQPTHIGTPRRRGGSQRSFVYRARGKPREILRANPCRTMQSFTATTTMSCSRTMVSRGSPAAKWKNAGQKVPSQVAQLPGTVYRSKRGRAYMTAPQVVIVSAGTGLENWKDRVYGDTGKTTRMQTQTPPPRRG